MVESATAAAAAHLSRLSLHPRPTTTSSAVKRPSTSLNEPTPKKQQLRRCISDPIASLENSTNPLLRSLSDTTTPSSRIPSSKKLKRVRNHIRKLIQRWEQILQEEEIKSDGSEENGDSGDFSNSSNDEGEREKVEAVSVEKTEDGSLLIHFNCPCNRAFQFLFSGGDCYYKLL